MANDIPSGQVDSPARSQGEIENTPGDAVSESLSALFDNEHSELDLRRVLKAAQSDSDIADKWQRLQLTRSVLQKQDRPLMDSSILSGVQAAIADESAPELVNSRFAGLRVYSGKVAVAACTCLAVLLGGNYLAGSPAAPTPESAQVASNGTLNQASQAVVPDGFELPPLQARTVSSTTNINGPVFQAFAPAAAQRAPQSQAQAQEVILSPELQIQLNRMLRKHAEKSAANGSMGMMPFTRVELIEEK